MSQSTIAVVAAAVLLVLQVGWPWFSGLSKWLIGLLPAWRSGNGSAPPAATVRLTDLSAIRRQLDRIEALLTKDSGNE
jgi:hypothetical protein